MPMPTTLEGVQAAIEAGQPDTLTDAGQKFQNAADAMDQASTNLAARTTSLNEAWKGAAYDSFKASSGVFSKAIQEQVKAISPLYKQQLTIAAQLLTTAKAKIAELVAQYNAALAALNSAPATPAATPEAAAAAAEANAAAAIALKKQFDALAVQLLEELSAGYEQVISSLTPVPEMTIQAVSDPGQYDPGREDGQPQEPPAPNPPVNDPPGGSDDGDVPAPGEIPSNGGVIGRPPTAPVTSPPPLAPTDPIPAPAPPPIVGSPPPVALEPLAPLAEPPQYWSNGTMPNQVSLDGVNPTSTVTNTGGGGTISHMSTFSGGGGTYGGPGTSAAGSPSWGGNGLNPNLTGAVFGGTAGSGTLGRSGTSGSVNRTMPPGGFLGGTAPGRGDEDRERERDVFLAEQDDQWNVVQEGPPAVLGRNS